MFNIFNTMKTLTERIQIVKDATKWNNAELSRQAGVSRTAITEWMKGNVRSLSADVATRLAKNSGFSAIWLAAGLGEMKDNDLLDDPVIETERVTYDVLDVKAACGDGLYNSDYPEVICSMVMPLKMARELIGNINTNGSIKVIMAAKDSMMPTINPSDLLFVDTLVTQYRGEGVYILLHGGEVLCKRLSFAGNSILVQSDNEKYAAWKWDERPAETRIIGKVLRALPLEFKNFGN